MKATARYVGDPINKMILQDPDGQDLVPIDLKWVKDGDTLEVEVVTREKRRCSKGADCALFHGGTECDGETVVEEKLVSVKINCPCCDGEKTIYKEEGE